MKCSPDQEQRGRSMFKIFVPCCLGSTISSQVAARYELVQTPFCPRGRNTCNFRDLCDFTARSSNAGCTYLRRALKPILKPDILLVSSCACESIWCYREGSCSVRGAPCGRPALLEQATLTLPLKSVPAALSTSRAAARPFRFSRISLKILSLSPQSKSFLASLCLTRKVLARASV